MVHGVLLFMSYSKKVIGHMLSAPNDSIVTIGMTCKTPHLLIWIKALVWIYTSYSNNLGGRSIFRELSNRPLRT
ncbi:hypothetical protein D3C72_1898840 [compost metagenome]